MTHELAVPLLPGPALAEARAALADQQAALSAALVRLERARALVPAAEPSSEWRGAAQSLYRSSVRELASRLDEAIDSVRSARRSTRHAVSTLAARG